jgi:ketosteroid isomerase-like protein
MTSDEDTLRRIFEVDGPQTMHDGDVEAYIGLWGGPDPMWSPQDVADVRGVPAIRAAVGALFAAYDFSTAFTADAVAVLGSRGYVRGMARLQLTAKKGGRVSVQWTREIWLFVQEAGGWKINGMIFNHKPAPG